MSGCNSYIHTVYDAGYLHTVKADNKEHLHASRFRFPRRVARCAQRCDRWSHRRTATGMCESRAEPAGMRPRKVRSRFRRLDQPEISPHSSQPPDVRREGWRSLGWFHHPGLMADGHLSPRMLRVSGCTSGTYDGRRGRHARPRVFEINRPQSSSLSVRVGRIVDSERDTLASFSAWMFSNLTGLLST